MHDASLSLDGVVFTQNDVSNNDDQSSHGGSGRIVGATHGSMLTLTNCQFESHYTPLNSASTASGSNIGSAVGSIWVGSGSSLWLSHVNASGSHNFNGPGGFLAMNGGGALTLNHLRAIDNSAAGIVQIIDSDCVFSLFRDFVYL